MHEIFLSYSRRDSSTVQALATALSERGHSIWLDRSGIEEGDAYDTQIEEAIAQTRVVIVIWSQHSIRSQWVRAEAAYALGRHKLLPIAIDKSEPPLQFLHIQTIDFEGWQGDCDGEAFSHLLAVLARRLDRIVAPAATAAAGKTVAAVTPAIEVAEAAPKAQAEPSWIQRAYGAGMMAAGLRFPEKVIEKEFRLYFTERTYAVAQFAILLGFVAYVVYGVSDMASDAGVGSTRFRFMIACPLLLMFYGLSFKKFAKQHAQAFIAAYALTMSVCVYISVALLSIETPFRIQTGNATMNFMLILGLLALLPLNVVYTVLIGATMSALHALIMMNTHVLLATSWLNYLHISSMWTIACCIAYFREYQQRNAYAAGFS
jgi:hypothetical protein